MDKKLEDILQLWDAAHAAEINFENNFQELVDGARKPIESAHETLATIKQMTLYYAPRQEVAKILKNISEVKRDVSAALMPDSTYSSIVRRIEKELALYHLGSGVPYTRSTIEGLLKKEGLEVRSDFLMLCESFRLDQLRRVKTVESDGETYYGVEASRNLNFINSKIISLEVEHKHNADNHLPFSFTAADIDIIN